ncbi:MAG: sigma-70 family RNA polymerase sigma factor, partial [Planctomycetota bacterium]
EFEETDEEDLRWVRATLAGDKTAYDKLYTKHRDRVYGVVYRVTRNREDALEGAQEVFVKVYRALPRYKAEFRFGAWLYRISMNHAIDIYRRKRVRKEQIYDQEFTFARPDAAVHQRFADPAEEMDRRQVARTIEDAMSSLSENHRQIFTLFSFDEMSYQEIADLLDIPIGTVMSRLYYARRKLQEALPEHWDPGGRKNREKRPGQAEREEVDHE